MVEQHADEQDKQVMDSEETIVEVSPHLSGGESPDNTQAGKHRPSGKANWCQENKAKYVLYRAERRKTRLRK